MFNKLGVRMSGPGVRRSSGAIAPPCPTGLVLALICVGTILIVHILA